MEYDEHLERIIGLLNRVSNIHFQSQFRTLELGHSQAKTLYYIYLKKKVLPKQIAEYFQLDKGSVTSLIKGLEKNGFLIRETHPTDNRCFYLKISTKAEEVIPEIEKVLSDWSHILQNGFSEKEKQTLNQLMKRMIKNVSAI
ncbi:MarR family winged helix-turn-helix transcriptional regulator [Croceimicrobium sp.]|uniref:MarR family winged helix-turn-helix transcriptional regulator n=1 Tax=Croceimicrobium sp. TaxID=2828340 RepID=UPI003BA8B9F4